MNIPSQLIEVIDIALAGYRKENGFYHFYTTQRIRNIQIVNRNMVQECKAENGALELFCVSASIEMKTRSLRSFYTRTLN